MLFALLAECASADPESHPVLIVDAPDMRDRRFIDHRWLYQGAPMMSLFPDCVKSHRLPPMGITASSLK